MIEVLFIALVIGVAAAWWWFPRWQLRKFYADITDAAEQADAEDKFRRTLSQVLGGSVLLAGLAVSFQEIQTARQGTEIARDTSHAQIEALNSQQNSQQFSRGVELLGEATLAERLGGIYTLEQVARRSETYHWPVMETLTSYFRSFAVSDEPVVTEVQAALTVIGRRETRPEPDSLNLSKIFLRAADLTGADLSGADLRQADLSEADLSGAILTGADLRGADLPEADLTGAILSVADLRRASLRGADLRGADLTEANLIGADLTGADLSGADLSGANLIGANLREAGLREAILTGVSLTGADLIGADLTGADLSGADLSGANLSVAELTGVSLTGADLIGADLTGADLSGADLSGADLSETVNLYQTQLDRACGDDDTKLRWALTIEPCVY